MRIGVNTRLLLADKMDGIGWFSFEVLRRMVANHPEHEFYFFFDRPFDSRFVFAENVHPVVLFPPARHPVLWFLFFELSMARAIKRYGIDLFFSPECYIPLRCKIPVLSTVHDINFEHNKHYLKPSHQLYMNYFASRFAHRSTRLATVSEYSKRDIVATYGVESGRVDVVYNGVNEGYHPLTESARQQVRDEYSEGCPYYIFIGTILKRKNLATLLSAFDKVKESDTAGTKLLVVGNRVWWQDELAEAFDAMRHKDDVIFLGRTSQDRLFNLLGSAVAMVYPSLFEGFGIPILEGFSAEVPVITSNCTAMPEVAGDAAILVDPTDVEAMADAMVRVVADDELRKALITKGREQRARFSWDKTAELLWKGLMRTYEEGGRNE